MAGGALGSLTVKLGLDAVDFTAGLSKADYQAKQFGESIGRGIQAGATLAVTAIGALSVAALGSAVAIDKLIKKAADFQDLAEMTGASAEGLASFGVAAGTAGTNVESIAAATIKLTKSLVGVDDESKAAGAALGAIGIKIEDFKKLDPVAQYEAVGKALGNFADGAGKTAVAVALFGKSGAEQLKVFKALEEQGGRQVILTAEQIRQADEYADRQARASAELSLYAQAVATEALPAIAAFTDALSDTIKELLGVEKGATQLAASQAVREFAQGAAIAIAEVIDAAYNAGKALYALSGSLKVIANDVALFGRLSPGGLIAGVFGDESNSIKNVLKKREDDLKEANQRYANLATGLGLADKLRANFAKQSFVDPRILGNPGSIAQQTGRQIDFSGPEKADKAAKAAANAAKKQLSAAESYIEALRKQDEKTEQLTATEKVLADIQAGRFVAAGKFTEAEALRLAREIDLSKEMTLQLKARRDAVVAEGDAILKANEARQASLKQMLDATPGAKLQKDRADVQLLTEEFEAGRLSEEKYLEAVTARLDLTKEKVKETKTLAEELGLTFSSAFEDAIVSGAKFSDVIKSLGQDLLKLAVRKTITEPLMNAIGGADFFSSIFGGGKAAGGPVDAGRLYRVNENGPEMLDVNGSQYLMMGSKGGTVRPGATSGSGGGPLVINVGAGASRAEVIAAVQQGVATSVGMVAESNRRRGGI